MAEVRAHLFIDGRVQGVSFRYATAEQARRLGVRGWVRNLPDGRIEAVFEGDAPAVERLIEWCRTGPPGAFVESVEVHQEEPVGDLADFRIERTPPWS